MDEYILSYSIYSSMIQPNLTKHEWNEQLSALPSGNFISMGSYTKLDEVKKDVPANIIVIFKYFTKAPPTPTASGKFYHTKIAVTDESIQPKDFKISLFCLPGSVQQLPRNTILRFFRVKIEEYKGMLDGRIFGAQSMEIIDPYSITSLHSVDPAAKERLKVLITTFPYLFDRRKLALQVDVPFSKLQAVTFEDTPFKLSTVTEDTTQDLIGVIDELWDYKINPMTNTWDDFSIHLTDNSIHPSTLRVFIKCCYETMPSLSRYSVLYLRNVKIKEKNWRIVGYVKNGDDVWDLNLKCGGPISDLDVNKLSAVPNAEAAEKRIHELFKWSRFTYEKTEEIERLSNIFGIKWEPIR